MGSLRSGTEYVPTKPIEVAVFDSRAGEEATAQDAVSQLSDASLTWVASTPRSLWERLAHRTPDVLLFSLDPDHEEMMALLAHVAARYPAAKLIAFSTDRSPELIISALRIGCSQFVFEPIEVNDLWQALQRVIAGSRAHLAVGRRVAVVGASGGAGATTIASNLATEIAVLSGKDTALLDMNLDFGDVASNFDCEPKHTIADLIGHDDIDESLLKHAMHKLDNNVWLLGRPKHIDDAFSVSREVVSHVLHLLPASFEASVIDAARRFDGVGMAVLENSDVTLIVMQLLVPHIRNGVRLYEAMRTWGVNIEHIHLVVNRYQKGKSRIEVAQVEKLFRKKVIAALPNDYRAVSASVEFGHPMMSESANSAVRLAIRDLANQLLQPDITLPTAPTEAPGPGFLKRIFS